MGKVTVYYTLHAGNPFEDPRFIKAFRKADVVDLEARGGVSARTRKQFQAIAAGDMDVARERYLGSMLAYAKTRDPSYLYNMSLINLLLGSKKKLDFESRLPRGARTRHKARMYGQFPILKKIAYPSGRRELAEESVRKGKGQRHIFLEYYGTFAKERIPAMVRSFADSERVARKIRLYPWQNRLVLRGAGHHQMSDFLRKKGMKARDITLVNDTLYKRVLSGKLPRESEILKWALRHALFQDLLTEGLKRGEGISATKAASAVGLARKRKR